MYGVKMDGGGQLGGNERCPGWDCCAARTLCLGRGMYGGWVGNMFAYSSSSDVRVTLVYIFLAPLYSVYITCCA